MPQAPTAQTCVSAGAPAEKLRPSTKTCRRYVAARINLPLYKQSRVYLLFLAAHLPSCSSPVATASRRWCLALANCNEHVAKENITPPAHTQRALHGAHISRGKSSKITLFSRSGYTRACHRHFLFSVPNCHTEFLTFLRSLPPFFSYVLPPPGCLFARDCAHAGGPVR
jgi:hypothetical protein